MERSAAYTLRFAAVLAVVASALVSTVSVALERRQEANRLLARRVHVLEVAGLSRPGEPLTRAEVARRFAEGVRPVVIELRSGRVAESLDADGFDPLRAGRDPATSRPAPDNDAGVTRVPEHVLVHLVERGDEVDAVVLPFEGLGLWSTVRGYIALSADLASVRGITFYEHAETPGLGARIEDPEWRALWVGRRVFDEDGRPRLGVVKGRAGTPEDAPFEVDGLAGATLTGDGVTEAVRFWLGQGVLGPYLDRLRAERTAGGGG